jgi:hypothetical protein
MATRAPLNPEQMRQALASKRFLAADRAGLTVEAIATWDSNLLREHRLLVPIDVQALYVPAGSTEKMVRLPLLVASADGAGGPAVSDPEDGLPDPFSEGSVRPAGVHLHWAMPDALLRGSLAERDDGSANRLSLPALPDRFVVLRLLLPRGGTAPVVTGWVIESDRAAAVPLAQWAEASSASQKAQTFGEEIPRAQLTGTVGGHIAWSGIYDAVLDRFAFHDPLQDIAALAPNGVDQDCVSYLVAGWWSDPALDPLDAARSKDSLDELLERLRWLQLHEWGDATWAREKAEEEARLREALGLKEGQRFSPAQPKFVASKAVGVAQQAFTPIDKTIVSRDEAVFASRFAADAMERLRAPAWQLRSSLLHGAIYGVPVAGPVSVDRRPAAAAVRVALGLHDTDLLAGFALDGATADQRRSAERLLAAFTTQRVNRLGSPDGLAEIEEHEHAVAFASIPSGIAGTDRFLQRVQTGGVGGLKLGRNEARALKKAKFASKGAERAAGVATSAKIAFASSKPDLVVASLAEINDLARSRVGEVLAPTEARIVQRPAPRYTFPTEPMVALRGINRSLRHGNDGRGSPDGKLGCRWPTHVITEISGICAPDRFIRTLGNGSIPNEALTLARELLLHDPYHHEWLAATLAPPGAGRTALLTRLKAESLLRFSPQGVYDGGTSAFAALGTAKTRAVATGSPVQPGLTEHRSQVAEELRRFSLYKGADPDLVGVTTWAQAWVPMWLEWEIKVEGLDPPAIEAWRLQSIDLEREAGAGNTIDGTTVALRNRALLTTGAAKTLSDAITDWLDREDKLDAVHAGLVDDATENAYRTLDTAVRDLDVVTAALDGVRTQLLGLPVSDGLRRRANGGTGVTDPAPIAPPHALLAGAITLTRARVLDAFGRTLELPAAALAQAAVPTRGALAARPGALHVKPRLLRPARWLFRLVEAGTPVGAVDVVEARVDQIEAALQVNPVCGFVMPDHLDESLEVFGTDGAPLGELLHEPVSGGVVWEIAAGRTGPADAGPLFDLAPAQQALGRFAAGLVAADAAARGGAAQAAEIGSAGEESALSALLRAIDTTLWSVDSFATLGSEHVAGLVGRPIAVVRAQLKLELQPPDGIDLSDAGRAAEWAAAEAAASRHAFEVRIGEITRSDDGVQGFFVDDDYSRFRIVDKVIAATAAEAGRSRGQLGLFARAGNAGDAPPQSAIHHPYIAGRDEDDTLRLHLNQTVTLTLLMHPNGKAHISSGLLPRKALALARDWVGKGLAAIAPSLRTGPVLVETDLAAKGQVRLPKVSVFGKNQNFLWRDTPGSWRSDAILAATQTALLPDTPAELREGWIRVAPDTPDAPAAPAAGGETP